MSNKCTDGYIEKTKECAHIYSDYVLPIRLCLDLDNIYKDLILNKIRRVENVRGTQTNRLQIRGTRKES
jgi:hypothetical protein